MITKVRNTLKKNKISENKRVLVALSGGVDSSVLLDVLIKLREELSISVCAAHLNHLLRGEDAMRDEEFVRTKCLSYGIDFISERIDIAKEAKARGESTELCARNLRYDFLERAKVSLSADFIATAHNANDNLETILFNLSRGSGIDGLCGIPTVRECIIRPLIECTRDEIEEYSRESDISFCVDKTNDEDIYSRNRIRHTVIPSLVGVNEKAVSNASKTAQILRCEAEFLNKAAKRRFNEISLSRNSCLAKELILEPALTSRICEMFAGRTLEFCHIEQIVSLAKSDSPSDRINLPGGLIARREYEKIVFEKEEKAQNLPAVLLSEGEFWWGEYSVTVKKTEKCEKIHNLLNTFFVSCGKIQGNLVIRGKNTGDEIKLPKRNTKTLKKLFIDEKIPLDKREKIPVIADDEKVFAVFGIGSDCRFCGDEGSGYFVKIDKK